MFFEHTNFSTFHFVKPIIKLFQTFLSTNNLNLFFTAFTVYKRSIFIKYIGFWNSELFGVKSISFSKSYSNCVECVRDPHCGWDREQGTCQGFQSHLLQDPMGEVDGICEASLNRQKIVANFGSAIHLECPLGNPETEVQWYHYNMDGRRRRVEAFDGKYVLTQDQGFVIIGLADQDAGQYDCRIQHKTISSYRIVVDFKRCSTPEKGGDYQKAYAEWCNEFQKYKNSLQMWEEKQQSCNPVSMIQSSSNPFF